MLKRLCALVIAGATLAACSESSQPTGVIPVSVDANQSVLAQLTCRVDAIASTLSCAPAGPAASSGRSSDLILGGQNVYVKMTSTNVVTNPTVSITADVTVKNLTNEPWNTGDGTTIDTAGVKVFFVQLPTSPVEISNPTDSAVFTSSPKQPYFKYSGASLLGADGILSAGETSAPINWHFTLNGATVFTFGVLIVAKMPDETGSLRWIGDTLTQAGPTEFKLAIWGSSPTDVWTGGVAGNTALHHYDGTSWTAFNSPISINGLWGTASNDVYAVASTRIEHFDGTSWTVDPFIADDGLNAIWGASATDIYAGGTTGTFVHYDGVSWSNVPSSGLVAGEEVQSIWGTSASNIYVGAVSATPGEGVHRWNGTSWSTVNAGINAVRSIWGSSANDIYIGGDFGKLRHWNGASWSTISGFGTTAGDGIQSVWGTGANSVYFVQRSGRIWHSVNGGATWFSYTASGTNLLGIWGANDRDIFIAGYGNGAVQNNVVIRGVR